MKQEDKQYEKWLTEVKSNQPILENPEELTATILQDDTAEHNWCRYAIFDTETDAVSYIKGLLSITGGVSA